MELSEPILTSSDSSEKRKGEVAVEKSGNNGRSHNWSTTVLYCSPQSHNLINRGLVISADKSRSPTKKSMSARSRPDTNIRQKGTEIQKYLPFEQSEVEFRPRRPLFHQGNYPINDPKKVLRQHDWCTDFVSLEHKPTKTQMVADCLIRKKFNQR